MAISAIPALTTHISFLLKSSTFGRPGLGRSPPFKWQFHRFLLYSESSYLVDQVLADLPSLQKAISQIPVLLLEFIFGRPGVGRSPPPSNGYFTDSCSDCSYFFPTLRAQHLADQVLADLSPSQMAISQIPALTAHISFLLYDFIFSRWGFDTSTPFKWQFHRFLLWLLIFHSYSRAQHLTD